MRTLLVLKSTLCTSTLLLNLLQAGVALAQLGSASGIPVPTPSPNIWHNYFTDIVKEDYSLMETENDPAGYGVHAEVQNSLSGIHFNRQNPCVGTCVPGSSSSSTTGYSHQEAPIDPGYRQVPIAAMLPSTMRTHVEAFKNRDFADREMSSSTIRLPYIVKEVSMHLTESAVAQGLFSASQKASAHQANMLLGDIRAMAMADQIPGLKPFVRTYIFCLQKYEPTLGEIGAHKYCTRDDVRPTSFATSAGTQGFQFTDDPAAIAPTHGSTGSHPNPSATKIRLTDFMFNEEANIGLNPSSSFPTMLRADFERIFGNIEFEMSNGTLTGSASSLAGWHGKYKVIQPTVAPAQYYLDKINYRYIILKGVLRKACENMNFTDFKVGSGTKPIYAQQDLERLSVPGYLVSPQMFYSFISLIKEAGIPITKTPPKHRNCTWFTPTGGVDELQTPTYRDPMPQLMREVFSWTRLTALLEILVEASLAEQALNSISLGAGMDSQLSYMQDLGRKLIYRTAGTNDIAAAQETVLLQLRVYSKTTWVRYAEQLRRKAQANNESVQAIIGK